jgi:DNA-binding NarL/FixJ family response regulator
MGNRNPADLSTREVEIAQLLAEGYSNRQIARHLSIAESTVKAHLTSILGKLGVRSRSQAASVVATGSGGWALD